MKRAPVRTCNCGDCIACEWYAARRALTMPKREGQDMAAIILADEERAREVADMRQRALEAACARAGVA